MTGSGKSPADRRRLERLASTPVTRAQVGAILGEYEKRMRINRRDQRLAISAALLGLDDLNSTWDLTMGQAGKLLHMLRATKDRAELDERVAAAIREHEQQRHDPGSTLAGILGNMLSAITGITNKAIR